MNQLLSFYSQIFSSVDQKNPCDIIFLDFRKAFDTIPHPELLYKLWTHGITGPLWRWFQLDLILSNSTHFVFVEGSSSSVLPVRSGQCFRPITISSYRDRLITLNLFPLSIWFEYLDITFLLNCLLNPPDHFNIFNIQFVSGNTQSSSASKLNVFFPVFSWLVDCALEGLYTGACAFEIAAIFSEILVPS